MSSDAQLSDLGLPPEITLLQPMPPPPTAGSPVRRALFAPGRLAYGLAWLSVLVLVVTAVLFWNLHGDLMLALKIVLSVVAVLAAACLHLAAVSLNRQRDVGFSVFALCLVVLFVLPLALFTTTVATASSVGAAIARTLDGFGSGLGSGAEPSDGFSPSSPGMSTSVPCVAPDGSIVEVDPQFCVGGHYTP
jgi:hypothetical protein